MAQEEAVISVDRSVDVPSSAQRLDARHEAAQRPASGRFERFKSLFSFPAMLGTFLVGRIFYEARNFLVDPDLWWHIKVGQDILRTHHFPTTDPYSFTAASTLWIAYEWLGEVVLASVNVLGGVPALAAFRIIVASLVILGLFYYGTLRSGNSKAGFVPAGALCSLAILSFTLRPQMFGYLFLVALLILLEWFRKGVSWPLCFLPLLFVCWVNTHGSFIVGIGVVALHLCCGLRSFEIGNIHAVAWSARQRIQLELALLGSLAVLPFTPYGTELAAYPFDMMLNQPVNVSYILEWRPIPFDQSGGKLFLAVVVLLVALQFLFRFRWHLAEVLLVLGGTAMACLHVRMLLLFVPFVVPIFATMVARWLPPYQRAKEHYALNAVLIVGVVAAIMYYVPSRSSLQRKVDEGFPVGATAYLNAHPIPGNLMNSYGFGGYLLANERKVFIDGRGDLFERTGVLSDYITLTWIKPGALEVLDRYEISHCMLLTNEPLSVVLSASPDWERTYADSTAVIYRRKPAGPRSDTPPNQSF